MSLSLLLFLATPRRQPWQWLIVGDDRACAVVTLLLLTPFTYSGGGGPVGNRYFLSFYPLFLFLTPALRGFGSACVALAVGALFTAKIVCQPVLFVVQSRASTRRRGRCAGCRSS